MTNGSQKVANPAFVSISKADDSQRIRIEFAKTVDRIDIDPPMAVEMAKMMIDVASECGYAISLQVPKKIIADKHREILINRFVLILNSLEGKTQAFRARALADAALQEVL